LNVTHFPTRSRGATGCTKSDCQGCLTFPYDRMNSRRGIPFAAVDATQDTRRRVGSAPPSENGPAPMLRTGNGTSIGMLGEVLTIVGIYASSARLPGQDSP